MEIMPILERKIAHKMTTLCSHMTYPEFVLPLHMHAEYQLIIFTHGSGKQFVGEGIKESGIKREMMQTGVLPLVKSVTPSRIKENFDVFDFELSQQEMFEIASLKADRIGSDSDTCDF